MIKKREKADDSHLNALRQNSIDNFVDLSSKTYVMIILNHVYKNFPDISQKRQFSSFIDFLLWLLTKKRTKLDFEEIKEKYNENGIREFVCYYFKYYDDVMVRLEECFKHCDLVDKIAEAVDEKEALNKE